MNNNLIYEDLSSDELQLLLAYNISLYDCATDPQIESFIQNKINYIQSLLKD